MASSGRNRSGSLYRRWKGREYAVDDKVALGKGVIWLRYMINGKVTKTSLNTSDISEAEQKQKKEMAPIMYADEKEALDQLVLKAKQAQQKIEVEQEANNPPLKVAEAWDAYLASPKRPDSGPGTLRNYSFQWKRFWQWHEKKYPASPYMKDVKDSIAEQYASDLINAKLSPSTYNKHIRLIKLVFKTLLKPAKLEANPFEDIQTKKKLKTKSKRELTNEELSTILEKATGDLKILLYIGVYTGMRLGDCALLKWKDVDIIDGAIKCETSKTDQPVMIGIPAPLLQLLSETPENKRKGYVLPKTAQIYKKDQTKLTNQIQQHFMDCGIQTHQEGTGYIKIPDQSGKHEYIWEYTGKRAVVEVGFHSLRHSYVSMLASAGTPQAVVQAIVGHGNPAMTRHYTHIGKEATKKAAAILDAGIQSVGEGKKQKKAPIPPWALDRLKKQTADTWEAIRNELVKRSIDAQ